MDFYLITKHVQYKAYVRVTFILTVNNNTTTSAHVLQIEINTDTLPMMYVRLILDPMFLLT